MQSSQLMVSDVEGRTRFMDAGQFPAGTVAALRAFMFECYRIPPADFYLEQEGRVILDSETIASLTPSTVYVKLRVLGGKVRFAPAKW